MPQCICTLCCDKINDFYEFREMCTATNIQTRKLLNLPDPQKRLTKKVTIKSLDDNEQNDVESIFGVVGDDIKSEPSTSQKAAKKTKKGNSSTPAAMATATNDARFRGMTKREIEVALELERIKKEEEEQTANEELLEVAATNRGKGAKKKEDKKKKLKATNKKGANEPTQPLLAPKELNQRERKREIEAKKVEKYENLFMSIKPLILIIISQANSLLHLINFRKRKSETAKAVVVGKKIKKEPGIICTICDERFEKNQQYNGHLGTNHLPTVSQFGCSSCIVNFDTDAENVAHHDWHKMFNIGYVCPLCASPFEKLLTFQRHLSTCTFALFAAIPIAEDILCELCNCTFVTSPLYDWHDCFIRYTSQTH